MTQDSTPIARWLGPPARILALATGWWLLLLSFVTCFEVLARKLFGFSLQGIDEVGGYTTAVISTFTFAWALLAKSHTRVDFLLSHLPAAARALLNAAAYALLAGLAVFATWRGWDVVDESLLFDSHSVSPLQTPMWIPQSLWWLGWAVFAVVAVVLAVHALWLLATDRGRLNQLYGPMTLDEEVELEASAISTRTAGKDTTA